MYIELLNIRIYPAAVVMATMVSSVFSPVYAVEKPRTQQFVVTAYYSPLPDQCCYYRGNYEEEIIFNGRGIAGADGTPVYPGMIAGPEAYSFGTVIDLPGVGVGTIHDRGGRIIEWGEDIHRIDIWMGYGEAGLARAMAWGVRNVKGTVYPVGSKRVPAESFVLENFDADSSALAALPKSDALDLIRLAELGDREYAVRILQSNLKDLGYFAETPTGEFGPVTQASLQSFQQEYGIDGDGSSVTLETAAALAVVSGIKDENMPELVIGLKEGSSGPDVRQAQKLLRYIGFYKGRTDGVYGASLTGAVTALQIAEGLVMKPTDTYAGYIGPGTRAAILSRWKVKIVAAKSKSLARKMDLTDRVKTKDLPKKFLAIGDRGSDVKLLQTFLIDAGYLSSDSRTGTFGGKTSSALLQYQLDRSIIPSKKAKGAGVFGPSTRVVVSKDLVAKKWEEVRAGR